jgi:hypothetical protein
MNAISTKAMRCSFDHLAAVPDSAKPSQAVPVVPGVRPCRPLRRSWPLLEGGHHVGGVVSTVIGGRWHIGGPNDASAGYGCTGVKN